MGILNCKGAIFFLVAIAQEETLTIPHSKVTVSPMVHVINFTLLISILPSSGSPSLHRAPACLHAHTDLLTCPPSCPHANAPTWRVNAPTRRRVNASMHQRVNMPTRQRANTQTRQRADTQTRERVNAPTCRRADAPTCQRANTQMRQLVIRKYMIVYKPAL